MGSGGSRPLNTQPKVVLVKGSDANASVDFTASSASEERKDDRDLSDGASLVQPFTPFEPTPEPRGASPATNLMVGSTTATVVGSAPRPNNAKMEETGTEGKSEAGWYLEGIDDEIEELGL